MKYKFIIIAILFIFNTISSFAQNKISGTLKDAQTNEPLIGAAVYISDLKTGATSDENGAYMIADLKNGNYLFEVTMEGYKTKIENIAVRESVTLNFGLEAATKELTEVIVTGVSRGTELRQNPINITTIDKLTMQQNSATNLIDGLKNVPGISQITTGAAISKPVIRGLGYNRVITLNNGVRQEGQQWGDEHGIEIDDNSVERVEIIKGPGSLMYGSDGIAGVINFIAPKSRHEGQIKTQFVSNYQTNNGLLAYSLMNAGNKNGLQWRGQLSNKFAGNYQNKYDGKVYNSGFREYDGSLFLGVNKNWGHTHLTVSSFNTILNLTEGERDSTGKFIFTNREGVEKTANSSDLNAYAVGFPHQKIHHFRVVSNNYFILKKGTLNFDVAFQNNQRKEFGDPQNPNINGLFFDLNTITYNTRYNLNAQNGWETSFGVSGMQQKNVNRGLEFLIPQYNLFDVGGFALTQKTFGKKLTLAGGLRFDNRNMQTQQLILDSLAAPTLVENSSTTTKFKAQNKNYSGVSGSIGASYQINSISTLKFNVSRGFRAPNIAELGSNGRHEGTFRYEYGDINLQSEISHQIDLAYSLNSDHVSLQVSPFVNSIQNFIYVQKLTTANGNDSIPDPSDPAPAYKFTQGAATLLGGELYIDVHPHPFDWLHFENSFSAVQATQSRATDSTRYLPNTPAAHYRGEIKAQFKTVGQYFSNAYAKFGVDYFFRQNDILRADRTETATPDYTLLNFGMGASVRAFGKKDGMNIYINAENLADVAYQNHLSRLKYAPLNAATGRNGVFNMGRNISVKLIFNL